MALGALHDASPHATHVNASLPATMPQIRHVFDSGMGSSDQ